MKTQNIRREKIKIEEFVSSIRNKNIPVFTDTEHALKFNSISLIIATNRAILTKDINKNIITKEDYLNNGPLSIYEMVIWNRELRCITKTLGEEKTKNWELFSPDELEYARNI